MNLANHLTILRILLIPVFISSLIYYSPERSFFLTLAIVSFLAACATDGLDGYVARKLNQKTVLGSYIDPIADKLLLLSAFISLSFMSNLPFSMKIPAWVTLAVITRDIVIILGSVLIFLTTGHLKAEPIYIGKLTTVVQMGTLVAALLSAPEPARNFLFISTAILTILSGLLYIRIGGKILQRL